MSNIQQEWNNPFWIVVNEQHDIINMSKMNFLFLLNHKIETSGEILGSYNSNEQKCHDILDWKRSNT